MSDFRNMQEQLDLYYGGLVSSSFIEGYALCLCHAGLLTNVEYVRLVSAIESFGTSKHIVIVDR